MLYIFKRENRTYCAEASSEEEGVIKLFNLMVRCDADRKAFTRQPWLLMQSLPLPSTAEAREFAYDLERIEHGR